MDVPGARSCCDRQPSHVSRRYHPARITDDIGGIPHIRDRDGATQTAGDQAENETDRKISANVREAVVADNGLSMNAHNVKIITSGGTVTLRGPVKSSEEKATIESKAKQVAGVTRVDNLLEIEVNR